jgi:cyanate permease
MDTEYNGWKNRQTWNVALWIGNQEYIYMEAVDFMQTYSGTRPYSRFIQSRVGGGRTPDNIAWLGTRLDYPALNEMMREFVA